MLKEMDTGYCYFILIWAHKTSVTESLFITLAEPSQKNQRSWI